MAAGQRCNWAAGAAEESQVEPSRSSLKSRQHVETLAGVFASTRSEAQSDASFDRLKMSAVELTVKIGPSQVFALQMLLCF